MADRKNHFLVLFDTQIENHGGPLEIVADLSRSRDLRQNVYDALSGGAVALQKRIAADLVFHPRHSHFHVANLSSYRLLKKNAGGVYRATPSTGTKTSVCIVDSVRISTAGPSRPTFTSCDAKRQGLDAGWADIYAAGLYEQWIDLGTAPLSDGDYAVSINVDPLDLILESDDRNNGGDGVLRGPRRPHARRTSAALLRPLPEDRRLRRGRPDRVRAPSRRRDLRPLLEIALVRPRRDPDDRLLRRGLGGSHRAGGHLGRPLRLRQEPDVGQPDPRRRPDGPELRALFNRGPDQHPRGLHPDRLLRQRPRRGHLRAQLPFGRDAGDRDDRCGRRGRGLAPDPVERRRTARSRRVGDVRPGARHRRVHGAAEPADRASGRRSRLQGAGHPPRLRVAGAGDADAGGDRRGPPDSQDVGDRLGGLLLRNRVHHPRGSARGSRADRRDGSRLRSRRHRPDHGRRRPGRHQSNRVAESPRDRRRAGDLHSRRRSVADPSRSIDPDDVAYTGAHDHTDADVHPVADSRPQPDRASDSPRRLRFPVGGLMRGIAEASAALRSSLDRFRADQTDATPGRVQ